MTGAAARTVSESQLALVVRIGANLHAMPIGVIEEILPALPIEAIPQCPPFVRGVVFVRGTLIPVLDAAERLGLRDHVRPLEPHIVCLRVGSRLVGLEVDEAVDLIDLPLGYELPVEVINARGGFLSGLVESGGQIIRILDAERLVGRHEAGALDALPQTASR